VLTVTVTPPGAELGDATAEQPASEVEICGAVLYSRGEEVVTAELTALREQVATHKRTIGQLKRQVSEMLVSELAASNHLEELSNVVASLEMSNVASFETDRHMDKLQSRNAVMEAQVEFYRTRHNEDDTDAEVKRLKEQLVQLQNETGIEKARANQLVQQVTLEKEAIRAQHKQTVAEQEKLKRAHQQALRAKDYEREKLDERIADLTKLAKEATEHTEALAAQVLAHNAQPVTPLPFTSIPSLPSVPSQPLPPTHAWR
jgi:chromosome segregation ATPase